MGSNPEYGFELAKSAAGAFWTVRAVVLPGDPDYAAFQERMQLYFAQVDHSSFSLHGAYLPELFDSQRMSVRSVGDTVRNGKALLQIDFSFAQPTAKGKTDVFRSPTLKTTFKIKSGKLWLDPAVAWSVAGGELTRLDDSTYVFSRVVGDGVLMRETAEITGNYGRYQESKQTTRVDYNCDHDKDVFRLTGYGLPEPHGTRPHRPWRMWLVSLTGVVLVFVGFLLIRRRSS